MSPYVLTTIVRVISVVRKQHVYFGLLVLTSRDLLGHAVCSIQRQNRVLGQRLLGSVLGFSGTTVVAEQVQVGLP